MDQFPSRQRSAQAVIEPRVTAVVTARNVTATALDLCLRSAMAEPWIDDIIVVNTGQNEEISSWLRALQADRRDLHIVYAESELSAAAAANRGAENARGRWILFLDPNVVLQRGAVSRMAAAGGGVAAPWIVGGRLTDLNGRERPAVRAGRLTAWSALAMAVDWPAPKPFRPRRRKAEKNAPRDPSKVAAVSSSLMLIPRGDFNGLQGFDENFATHAADLDLCRRASDAGGSVMFQPEASGVQFAAQGVRRREAQGLALFMTKSAKTPIQKAVALIAGPAFAVLVAARDLVAGRPPVRR